MRINRKLRRALVVGVVLGALLALALVWSMFGDLSSFQAGLDQLDGLPAAASDITACRNRNMSGVLVADFKIPETDFPTYAASNHWTLQPISGLVSVAQARSFQQGHPGEEHEITGGYYYSKHGVNGAGITVAFDHEAGRAFLFRSSR